jgi:glycosyltransferase involved in cell wall biosynthesis
MKNSVWIVTRDDEFYIDMAIKSVIDYVDGVYVLDTGSKDNTFSKIFALQRSSPTPIVYEHKDFGGPVRFSPEYREAEARNHAMKRCTELFKSDWLIQLDSDEAYNEKFFEVLRNVQQGDGNALGHSTLLLTAPTFLSWNKSDLSMWAGIELHDPHVRAWRSDIGIQWENRAGQHVIPRAPGRPDYLETLRRVVTPEYVHFHLHRSFGPKCIATYLVDFKHAYEGASRELGVPMEHIFDQPYLQERYPDWFVNGKFKPKKEVFDRTKAFSREAHVLPDFIVERWLAWGDWANWN